MGCLNSGQGFDHWFANIHLSGPCNRSCYFCIGQWMPGQDMNNNLGDVELKGYDKFLAECRERNITEVNITGTNTDPLMFKNLAGLLKQLRNDGFTNIGIRTNAVQANKLIEVMPYIDKFSVSVTSFDPELYLKTMGSGWPPILEPVIEAANQHGVPVKLNVVLCPETQNDITNTILKARDLGIKKINFREPYGQTHIGNPFSHPKISGDDGFLKRVFGNPCYNRYGVECTYWDVHYTQVESVNLYADGHVSIEYPISLGHSKTLGQVKDQSNFETGRQRTQWVGTKSETVVE